jgi:2-phospho-L-lactate guanylyltransferase
MTVIALIPVKDLDQAKARLAPVLEDAARRELVLAMLHDILDAALGCAAIDGVAVVTRDPLVLALAASLGAEALPEAGGLNEALDAAAQRVAARGTTRVAVIAADLPFAGAAGIATVIEIGGAVALVPSQDGGTNALACAPEAFAFAFGPDSAARHVAAAQAAGAHAERLDLPDIAFDVDTPDDFQRLLDEIDRAGAYTRAALERMGLVSAAR